MLAVPGVDLPLERVAPLEQSGIAGREAGHERGKAAPKGLRRDPRPGDRLSIDEIVQTAVDVDAVDARGLRHARNSPVR